MANELTLFLDAMDAQNALEHHGVKGMHWGKWNEETRRRRLGLKSAKNIKTNIDKVSNRKQRNKAIGSAAIVSGTHLAASQALINTLADVAVGYAFTPMFLPKVAVLKAAVSITSAATLPITLLGFTGGYALAEASALRKYGYNNNTLLQLERARRTDPQYDRDKDKARKKLYTDTLGRKTGKRLYSAENIDRAQATVNANRFDKSKFSARQLDIIQNRGGKAAQDAREYITRLAKTSADVLDPETMEALGLTDYLYW